MESTVKDILRTKPKGYISIHGKEYCYVLQGKESKTTLQKRQWDIILKNRRRDDLNLVKIPSLYRTSGIQVLNRLISGVHFELAVRETHVGIAILVKDVKISYHSCFVIHSLSDTPDVTDFISESVRNVFFKQIGIRSEGRPCFIHNLFTLYLFIDNRIWTVRFIMCTWPLRFNSPLYFCNIYRIVTYQWIGVLKWTRSPLWGVRET